MKTHSYPFRSLAIKDLLEARDAYHVHLANLENVIGTAIGLYRIRRDDPDATVPTEETTKPKTRTKSKANRPRTLANTVVKPWSWPSILVFVREWQPPSAFAKSPDNYIPPRLYLPDGRIVPTCVIYVEHGDVDHEHQPALLHYPSNLAGGGYPAVVEAQGQTRMGTIGCLVSDGQRIYALTNRHVAGRSGQSVSTQVGHDDLIVGKTAGRQVGRKAFPDAYPGWPGSRTEVNVDAALIELDDVTGWTTQVLGTAQMGELVDLNPDTMGLWLIGQQVRGFGGASGELLGEIHALFYRYRTLAGIDEVADFLIGPRQAKDLPLPTRRGDSGTVWLLEPEAQPKKRKSSASSNPPLAPTMKPFALQWGGHDLMEAKGRSCFHFVLASNLTTICRALDVEVLRDWNSGRPEYWGETGHYTIGGKACDLIANSKLRRLMRANIERVSFNEVDIRTGQLTANGFFPLADVPDTVWKRAPHKRYHEGPNHFADMDEKAPDGTDLFSVSNGPQGVTPKAWDDFYKLIGKTPKDRGLLPFRAWQLYAEMVKAVRARDLTRYVAVAGVLAHYVGDACQPLHASRLHDGTPGAANEAGVHSAYETKMLKRFANELYSKLETRLGNKRATTDVQGGQQAAVSVVKLMRDVAQLLPPKTIIDAYVDSNHTVATMWQTLGDTTAKVVANGCLRLSSLWQSAWVEGNGDAIPVQKLRAIDFNSLKQLYEDASFVPSLYLPELIQKPQLLP